VSYQWAETVAVGSVPTSGQHNTLARAFNDRLKAGVADPTWSLKLKGSSSVSFRRNKFRAPMTHRG
jgi:hypothetical protein